MSKVSQIKLPDQIQTILFQVSVLYDGFCVYSVRINDTNIQNETDLQQAVSITHLLHSYYHTENMRITLRPKRRAFFSKCVKVVTVCDRTASAQHVCFQQQPESPLIHNDLEVQWRQRKHLNREEKYDSVRRDSVPGSRLQGCQWVMLCHSHKRLPSSAKSQRAAFPSLSNRK